MIGVLLVRNFAKNSPETFFIAGHFFSPRPRRARSTVNNQLAPARVSASATMAAAGGENEGVGDENVTDPEPATQDRADDGAGPSEPVQVDVDSLRRRVLDLANRETEAKETLAPLEAASRDLGQEVEALKRAADDAKRFYDGVKALYDAKKAQGLFGGDRGARVKAKLDEDLNAAKSMLEKALAAATAKRNARTEANKQVAAQKEVLKSLRLDSKEAKTILDSVTVKGADVNETCPGCAHGNVTKAGKTPAGAQRFACKCAFQNCSSCPVCVPRRDPNLPLTQAVMNACECNICRCHCLCTGWTATPASRAKAKLNAEEMAAKFLADTPNPSQDAVSMVRNNVEFSMTTSQEEAFRSMAPEMAAAALREGATTMRVGVAGSGSVTPGVSRNHTIPAGVAERLAAVNGVASEPGSSAAGGPMGPPPPRAPNPAAATSSSQTPTRLSGSRAANPASTHPWGLAW